MAPKWPILCQMGCKIVIRWFCTCSLVSVLFHASVRLYGMPCLVDTNFRKQSIWKILGPFATASRHMPPVLILHCRGNIKSMSTTTTRDRGDCYGPIEWAQLLKWAILAQLLTFWFSALVTGMHLCSLYVYVYHNYRHSKSCGDCDIQGWRWCTASHNNGKCWYSSRRHSVRKTWFREATIKDVSVTKAGGLWAKGRSYKI